MTLIYEALLGLAPSCRCSLLQRTKSHYALCLSDIYQLTVPRVWIEMGKQAFSNAAPSSWNTL